MSIIKHIDNALLTPEHIVVLSFYTCLTDIVTGPVIAITFLYIFRRYLFYIAKKVTRCTIRVIPYCTTLNKETREAGKLLGQGRINLYGKLLFEDAGLIPGLNCGFIQALFETLHVDADNVAKGKCIKFFHLIGNDHKVIYRFILNQNFFIPVEDNSSGRESVNFS
ncbi:hypothetical protein D3C71_1639460 [compost metagenome]